MRIAFAVLLSLLAFPALALEPYRCRNGAFPGYGEFSPAEISVRAGEKVHFQNDWTKGCPGRDECFSKEFLVDGDKVLIAHPQEGWACAFRTRDGYAGFIPFEKVKKLAFSPNPDTAAWQGQWFYGPDEIAIVSKSGGLLKIAGNAKWYGNVNSFGEQVVHVGQVEGVSAPKGNRLTVSHDGCAVNLELVGPYLVVMDNTLCGGMNVRFNGVYQKKS